MQKRIFKFLFYFVLLSILVSACQPTKQPVSTPTEADSSLVPPTAETLPPTPTEQPGPPAYLDVTLPAAERAADLLSRMSLPEKIGQMTQVEKGSIDLADVTDYYIGSILSGGGGYPSPNTAEKSTRFSRGSDAPGTCTE